MEPSIEVLEPVPQLDRASLLDTIDTIFSKGSNILIIRGEEEIGKTTLLKQFSRRHFDSVIGIFISPQSKWAYDEQNILTELYQSLTLLLRQKPDLAEEITVGDIRSLYLNLSRRARQQNRYIYFILDGIDDIPSSDNRSRKAIVDMLPIGYVNFRFLISTEKSEDIQASREFFVPPFSTDETAHLFTGLNITRRQIEEIRQTFRGVPGHMIAVRRIARRFDAPNDLFEDLPKSLAAIFELEWKDVDAAPEFARDALAIIAFDRKDYSYATLGEILGQDVSEIRKALAAFSFIGPTQESNLAYCSDSYKKFACTKLRSHYTRINNAIIDYLLKTPQSEAAIRDIPGYLFQARRFDELITYLSPAHFTTLLERSESLVSLQQKAQLGVRTASELHRYGDLLRFGVQLSSTGLVAGTDAWRTEVEARIALGDHVSAKRIALNTLLKENRFHLLVVIAKTQRELDLVVDPDILAQIDLLYNEINFEELGDRAHEIAADLIFVRPNLAIQVTEKASRNRAEKSVLDWELASLSFDAAREQLPKEREYKTAQLIQSKLYDPGAQRFSAAAWLFLGTYSAAEAIAEVQLADQVSERLSLLRLWTKRNHKRADAVDVIKYALDLAIRETSYSITAQVLLDLACPLPYIQDKETRRSFCDMFEAQRAEAERLGPTDAYIDMYLVMLRAESLHERPSALLKLTDLFIQISYIPDISTRASCQAKFIVALMEIDQNYELERSEQLHSMSAHEFRMSVDKLLRDSAEHLAAINVALRTLARYDYQLVIDVATKLNSIDRRDNAYMVILRSILRGELTDEQVSNAIHACKSVRSIQLRDGGFYQLVRVLSGDGDEIVLSDKLVRSLITNVLKIEQVDLKCRAAGLIYSWLVKKDDLRGLSVEATELKSTIARTWESIDSAWVKADVGFQLVKNLSATDTEFAQLLISKCDAIRREQVFGVDTTISVYSLSIQLAVRAFAGLLPRKLDSELDLARMEELISHIPCRSTQAQVWADVALRFSHAKRVEECRTLVSTKIIRLIDELYGVDQMTADQTLVICSPSIYAGNPLFAIQYVRKLRYPEQDRAWSNICESIILGRNPFDQFDRPLKLDTRLSYEQVGEILSLAENVFADNILYSIISDISQVVSLKRNKSIFSGQQKTEIIRRLDGLIKQKLPNREFIQHDGWKILALAQLERIRHSGVPVWQQLLAQARSIPNVADRVLVLAGLAGMSWGDSARSSEQVFEEAYQLVKLIPTTLDQIMRFRAIASESSLSEPAIARKCLSDAMRVAVNADESDENAANERRRIIDLAYKMDPALADKLADMADSDPARLHAREELRHELRVLKGKQDIFGKENAFSASRSDLQNISLIQAAERALASLNAGRTQPLDKDRVQESVRFASTRPFSQTYPVFALAVESMVKRYRDTPEAATYLRAIFDGSVRATEIVWRVTVRTNGMIPIPMKEPMAAEASSIIIKTGEQEKAREFIESWLRGSAAQYIKICDPYFCCDDLDWIKIIHSVIPSVRIQILTGSTHQEETSGGHNLASSYRTHWRMRLSDHPPPDTEIWIVGTEKDGIFPIHDRWMLSLNSGLRLGTSLNGFGCRESEISMLSTAEVSARTSELDRYFLKQVREHQGQRLKYHFFDL